jgi:hypothetical protein
MTDTYKVAVSYRDSILTHHRILCGDAVGEGIPWQEQAMRLSHELERYASFLRDCVGGGYPGPVAFPSWDEDAAERWDGYQMVCDAIRKADLIDYLEQSRSTLRDAPFGDSGEAGLNASLDAMRATSLAADATTFLRALGVPQED